MGFSEEDKVLINVLHQEKGYGAKRFIKEFPNKNWSLSSLKKLLTKTDQTVSVDCKPGSGKSVRFGLLRMLIQILRSWC